jgi:antitoxin component of MazEF toxin-antitoxin module
MRALQKLVKNGNATSVSIPRQMLIALGWLPGQSVIIEILEDMTIRVRRPRLEDVAPVGPPMRLFDAPSPGPR